MGIETAENVITILAMFFSKIGYSADDNIKLLSKRLISGSLFAIQCIINEKETIDEEHKESLNSLVKKLVFKSTQS